MTDRWHLLADAMRDSNLTAADKSVFRVLLDKADWTTVELPAKFTPTRQTIARQASLSRRQVRYSAHHLQRHDWLIVKGSTGPGKTLAYEFAVGCQCDCEGRVHVPGGAADDLAANGGNGGNIDPRTVSERCPRLGATEGGNAAGQRPVFRGGKERQRGEGGFPGPQLRKKGDLTACPSCGAEGIVGVRLVAHDPECRWLAVTRTYEAER